jgi:GNAT superfamily N-acetyltransferase
MRDVSFIEQSIANWLSWRVPRVESIKRAIENKEILVACKHHEVMGFIHYPFHEDIIDGGPNSFVTCMYVAPKFRDKGIGSELLEKAIKDAVVRGVKGMETSTASPQARRFYESHWFKQFMGKDEMGEVFLELDLDKYKRSCSRKN